MIQEYFGIQLSRSVHIALPLANVETIARFQRPRICPIPGVAPFWLGVVNQRGSLLWVLDGDCFFNLVSTIDPQEQKLIVVVLKRRIQGVQQQVAWMVKSLEGVLSLDNSQSQPLPPTLEPRFQNLFKTIVTQDNKPVAILNSEAFFQVLRPQSATLVST